MGEDRTRKDKLLKKTKERKESNEADRKSFNTTGGVFVGTKNLRFPP